MIEPINYGAALRKAWRLLVVFAVVFAVVAAVVPVSATKSKKGAKALRWKSSVIVGAPPESGLGNSASSVSIIDYWANTYSTKVAAIDSVHEGADKALAVKLINAMGGTPTIVGPVNTTATTKAAKASKIKPSVVLLSASDQTAKRSANLANAFALSVQNAVNKSYEASQEAAAAASTKAGSGSSSTPSGYNILVPASSTSATKVAGTKASLGSSRKVRILIGLIIGLVIGAALVLIRELLDRRIRTATRAESTFRYPVVAEVPGEGQKGEGPSRGGVQVLNQPDSPAAEAYRMLRMSVLFEELAPAPAEAGDALAGWQVAQAKAYEAPTPGSRQVVLVVSAGNEVSRPMAAANLGATYAEAGQRVIVISTDDIGSGYSTGAAFDQLTTFGPADLAVQLQPSSLPNVSRLSLRPFVRSSSQLVNRASELLEAARQLAEVIIVETPSLLTVHHGEALVHAADVVLVVAEAGTTTMDEARRSSDVLRRLGAPVLGVVLTNAPVSKDQRQLDGAKATTPAETTTTTSNPAQPVPEATQA
jgi:Mrp family chromosome partitioning ATPase/capsular polysaccharide biosynthesis protein